MNVIFLRPFHISSPLEYLTLESFIFLFFNHFTAHNTQSLSWSIFFFIKLIRTIFLFDPRRHFPLYVRVYVNPFLFPKYNCRRLLQQKEKTKTLFHRFLVLDLMCSIWHQSKNILTRVKSSLIICPKALILTRFQERCKNDNNDSSVLKYKRILNIRITYICRNFHYHRKFLLFQQQ